MKSDQIIIRKNLIEQLDFITNLLGIKDPNITILDILDARTHKEIIAKLDYLVPKCPYYQRQIAKYDFQKEENILPRVCRIQNADSVKETPFPV